MFYPKISTIAQRACSFALDKSAKAKKLSAPSAVKKIKCGFPEGISESVPF